MCHVYAQIQRMWHIVMYYVCVCIYSVYMCVYTHYMQFIHIHITLRHDLSVVLSPEGCAGCWHAARG